MTEEMKERISKRKEQFLPVGMSILFACFCFSLLTYNYLRCGKTFSYSVDDAFIHLSIAKNLAYHGLWGPTPFEAVPASSSPLWTLLLTALYGTTNHPELIPFLLNLVAGCLLTYLIAKSFQETIESKKIVVGLTIITLFFTAIPMGVFVGMEHLLHSLVFSMFVLQASKCVSKNRPSLHSMILLFGLSVTAVLLRYESIAIVLFASVYFLVERRWWSSLFLIICGLAPIIGFGLYFNDTSGSFIPASISVKSHFDLSSSFNFVISIKELVAKHLIVEAARVSLVFYSLTTALCVRLFLTSTLDRTASIFLLAGTLAHVVGGSFNGPRYEIYLLVLPTLLLLKSVVAGWTQIRNRLSQLPILHSAVLVSALVFSVSGLLYRALSGVKISQGVHSIYQQQGTLARIVATLKTDRFVVLNDIGYPTFMCDFHLLDIAGLATAEVSQMIKSKTYTRRSFEALLARRNPICAFIYTDWLEDYVSKKSDDPLGGKGFVPSGWVLLGELQCDGNTTAYSAKVQMYACSESDVAEVQCAIGKAKQHFPVTVRFVKTDPISFLQNR